MYSELGNFSSKSAGVRNNLYKKAMALLDVVDETKAPNPVAINLLQELAIIGHSKAQYQMAFFHYFGIGFERNLKIAIEWLRQAARQGHPESTFRLGVIYQNQKDLKRAIYWYRRAIKQGHPIAKLNLGVLYRNGQGVKRNPFKAFSLYLRAAKSGVAEAMHNLGVLYEYGEGTHYSGKKAIVWFMRAYKADPEKYGFIPERIKIDFESITTPPGPRPISKEELSCFPALSNVTVTKGNPY